MSIPMRRVEADTAATTQAMGVVVLSSIAQGIAGLAQEGGIGFVGSALVALTGWFIWAFLVYIIGTKLLPEPRTHSNLGELLRTTGFSASPGLLRVLGRDPAYRRADHCCSEYLDADCHDHRGASSTGLSEHGSSCGGLSDWMVRLCRDHTNAFGGKNCLAEEQEGSLLPILTRNPLGDVLQLSKSSKPSSWQRTTA